MLSTLFLEGDECQTENILSGLSPEFFMKVEWLPGGRFEEGEFIFDSLFDEAASLHPDADVQELCDRRAKASSSTSSGNMGTSNTSMSAGCPKPLSLTRPQRRGRRGVYIAEFQSRAESQPIKRFIRLQNGASGSTWTKAKTWLMPLKKAKIIPITGWIDGSVPAVGMNLTRRVIMRRLSELYTGSNPLYRNEVIRTTYFEREYLPGIASDKTAIGKLRPTRLCLAAGELLGQTAASSMVVGRWAWDGGAPRVR